MDTVTRRRFLLASGVAGGAAIVSGAVGLGLNELLETAGRGRADGIDPGSGTLVFVTLYGGNDGLNTLVPYTDKAYYAARPGLACPADQVLKINDRLGLNGAMPGLKRLWDAKRLAVIPGVGYPKPDRSHFRSMDIWQTGSPSEVLTTGWVGRWLDAIEAPAETAVSFENVLPPLLAGQKRAGACVSVNGLKLPKGISSKMVASLGRAAGGESELQARAAQSYNDLLRVEGLVQQAAKGPAAAVLPSQPARPATATGGDSVLSAQLSQVAMCIEAGVPTSVYSVSLGGFDMHADELEAQQRLLGQLDTALGAFSDRMQRTDAGRNVVVVVYSEFGRRVRANASQGTDHGTAGPVFVFGPAVKGGLYAEHPSLTDLDDGDLKRTTDYRDVFGEVMRAVLKIEPERYISGHKFAEMNFIAYE